MPSSSWVCRTLDPIYVYWLNYELGKGHVTITCYGSAWTAYFNAMGQRTIQQFFKEVDVSYIVGRLMDAMYQKHTKAHEKYLERIVRAIKEHL